jgi:tetratricopeptide (TPR) repeat protein
MFLRAIELEPDFALAYLGLAKTYVGMYSWYYDHTEDRLKAAKEAIDKAFQISPNLPEAHLSLGWYYYKGYFDHNAALKEFAIARRHLPNNSGLIRAIAQVKRRQGKWDEALADFRLALRLNPRNAGTIYVLAGTLLMIREYEEAESLVLNALKIEPDLRWPYVQKIMLYQLWQGDTQKARAAIEDALQRLERWPMLTYLEIHLDLIEGKYQHAFHLLSGGYRAHAIASTDTAEYHVLLGSVYEYIDSTKAVAHYDSARIILERDLVGDPENQYLHLFLGQAYAGLGYKDRAVQEAQEAVRLYPVSKDAFAAPDFIDVFAQIYAITGEQDLAIEQLEYLFSIPSWMSVPYVKILPNYRRLHDHPRFQKLMKKYKQE